MQLECEPGHAVAPIEAVRALESMLLAMPQIELPTQHIVFGKVSARAIFIPAGTALTGALTNCDNVCIVVGDIAVTTDAGPRCLTGFNMLPAQRGAKRAGLAHADTWWVTVHHTELTNVRDVEDEMTDESETLGSRRAGLVLDAPLGEGV